MPTWVPIGQSVLGLGGGLAASLWFLKWLCEFVAKRMDARAELLTKREAIIDGKVAARLRHVEEDMARYFDATTRLLHAVAEMDPKHPVLADVARILRRAIPVDSLNPQLDELRRSIP